MRLVVCSSLIVLAACPGPGPTDDDGGVRDGGSVVTPQRCTSPEVLDADQVDAGAQALQAGLGGTFAPRLALENLYMVWGGAKPADFWKAFRERYGFLEAPTANDGLPWGIRKRGTIQTSIDCLACHAGRVAGESIVGAANTRLDLQLLIDDLKELSKRFGQTPPAFPTPRTAARGIGDIVGMTMQLATRSVSPAPAVNTECGYQDPPAWWTLRSKTRMYTDGSAPSTAHRAMMATLIAFGANQAELEAREPEFINVRTYLASLPTPKWPFAIPDTAAVARGQALFESVCARCHGSPSCERVDSKIVSLTEVGTDEERATRYSDNEISLLNLTWFGGVDKHTANHGYVAPSLKGVWASAPYLHNGSVPNLRAMLDSTHRPTRFRLRGVERDDYDETNVGLKYDDIASAPTQRDPSVYDTTLPGLSNKGHTFGDFMDDEQRNDMLEFLKTQ